MPTVRCLIGACPWSQARDTVDELARLRLAHERLRHPDVYGATTNQPIAADVPVVQLPPVDWRARGLDTIAALPANSKFTLYEVCRHLGEPPTSNGWQQLARDAHHLGLVVDAGGVNSKRPGTRGSKTTLWQRTLQPGRRTA